MRTVDRTIAFLWLCGAGAALVADAIFAPEAGRTRAVFAAAAAAPALAVLVLGGAGGRGAGSAFVNLTWIASAAALVAAGGWPFAPVFAVAPARAAAAGDRSAAAAVAMAAALALTALVALGRIGPAAGGILPLVATWLVAATAWRALAAARGRSDIAIEASAPDAETLEGLKAALAEAERERDDAVQATRERSHFFASMSHELRTPLNAVLGFSETMQMKLFGPMPAKYSEYAGLIHESAKYLLDLIGDVLDINRIEEGRYELSVSAFDARDALHAADRLMRANAEGAGVTLETRAGSEAVPIEADLRALKQILLNLASNAVKFTPREGVVTLALEVRDDAVAFVVRDTGPGLTPDEIARIGRPYEQTERGKRHEQRSSGMGLALVRSLAELHGGRLEVESVSGQGATFRVVIPRRLPARERAAAPMDARGRLQRVKAAGFADSDKKSSED